jgi:hypothetical protein
MAKNWEQTDAQTNRRTISIEPIFFKYVLELDKNVYTKYKKGKTGATT